MKIALIQFETKIRQDFFAISNRVIDFIKKAKKENSQLICFPEDFWFGPLDYYSSKEIEKITTNFFYQIINWFCHQAKRYSINIIPSSFIVKEKNHYFNQTFFINKKGKIVLTHKKQKLVPFGFEGKKVFSGKNDFDVLAGRTQVCLPFYGCVKSLKQNKEGMIVFDFDKTIIDDARKAYQLFK
jgi:predicted amidohydrolase